MGTRWNEQQMRTPVLLVTTAVLVFVVGCAAQNPWAHGASKQAWKRMREEMLLGLWHEGVPGSQGTCQGPLGHAPLRFNLDAHVGKALAVCCHNTAAGYYAEPVDFYKSTSLFAKMAQTNVMTFYDPVCGKPLFRAPIGRSLADFQAE